MNTEIIFTQIPMKKGFLFGLGVLLAGSALAATISTVSIPTKTSGDPVTHGEFNSITSGVNALTDTFDATNSTATSITIPKNIISTTEIAAPKFCLNGDCKTSWPAGGAGGVTAMTCPAGQQLQSVTSAGVFTCDTDMTAAAGTGVTDQQCGAGQVVKGITSGTFDCIADATGGTSAIGTLVQANWCWTPDGTTINCDREAPGGGATCVAYQYHKCVANKLWWFDSCDTMDMTNPKQDCTALGGCTAGEIGGECLGATTPTCVDYQYHKCVANKLQWFDSCDVDMNEVKTDCTNLGGCAADVIGGECNDPNAPYTWKTGEWSACAAEYSIEAQYEALEQSLESVSAMYTYYDTGAGSTLPVAAAKKTALSSLKTKINTEINNIVQKKVDAFTVSKKTVYSSQEDADNDGFLTVSTAENTHSEKAKAPVGIRTRDVFCADKFGVRVESVYCNAIAASYPIASEACTIPVITYSWAVGPWSECGSLTKVITSKTKIEKEVDQATLSAAGLTTEISRIKTEAGLATLSMPNSGEISAATTRAARRVLWLRARGVALEGDLAIANERKVAPPELGGAYPAFGTFSTDVATFVNANGTFATKASTEHPTYQTRTVSCTSNLGSEVTDDSCVSKKPAVYRTCLAAVTRSNIKWIIDGWSACSAGVPKTRTRSVRCSWCEADRCVLGQESNATADAICAAVAKPATSETCNNFIAANAGTEAAMVETAVSSSTTISTMNTALTATTAKANAAITGLQYATIETGRELLPPAYQSCGTVAPIATCGTPPGGDQRN